MTLLCYFLDEGYYTEKKYEQQKQSFRAKSETREKVNLGRNQQRKEAVTQTENLQHTLLVGAGNEHYGH